MNTPKSTGKAWDQLEEKVDSLVKALFEPKVLAGMTVAVTKAGRLILSKGYGYAFVDGMKKLPMKPLRQFHSPTNFMLGRNFVAVTTLVAALFTTHSHAANGEWTTIASACALDESATGRYVADGAAVYLASGATGDIVLRCNVTDPADWFNVNDPLWNRMDVTFNDTDGQGIDKVVTAQLRRVHEATGASSTVVTFTSNVFAAGQQLRNTVVDHVFDFYNYAYYVQITLRRNSLDADGNGVPDQSPRIQRVRLYTDVTG